MDDEQLIIIGALAIAGYIIYQKRGKGIETASTGVGTGIGDTGIAIGSISKTTAEVINSDLQLFDIPKQTKNFFGSFINFFQNLNPKNKNLGNW